MFTILASVGIVVTAAWFALQIALERARLVHDKQTQAYIIARRAEQTWQARHAL